MPDVPTDYVHPKGRGLATLNFAHVGIGPKVSMGPRGEEHIVTRSAGGNLWTKSSPPLRVNDKRLVKDYREMRTASVLLEALNAAAKAEAFGAAVKSDESRTAWADAFLIRVDGGERQEVQVGMADTDQERWQYYANLKPGEFVVEEGITETEYAQRIINAVGHKDSEKTYSPGTKARLILALDAAAVPEAIDDGVRALVRQSVKETGFQEVWVCGHNFLDAWKVC